MQKFFIWLIGLFASIVGQFNHGSFEVVGDVQGGGVLHLGERVAFVIDFDGAILDGTAAGVFALVIELKQQVVDFQGY